MALRIINKDALRLEVTMNRLPLDGLLIVMTRHRHRVFLSECDLLGLAVGPSLLQRCLFLLNQINQGKHEGHFPINGMPRRKEFFESEGRRVAEQGLEHGEHIFHEVVVAVGCQLEPLLSNVVRYGP